MSQEIAVVAIGVAKPGMEEALEAAIRPCVPETLKEQGCLAYTVHKDVDKPQRFVFVERWASREALSGHEKEPHFLTMVQAMAPCLAEPFQIMIMRALP